MIATDTPGFQIKSAIESDVPVILSFVKKLARYERLLHEVVATEELLRETLFGKRRTAEVAIGYLESQARRFCSVLSQLFHVLRETRPLHRGSLRG